jgi:ribosomal protein S18 acetylase RimI-like enzyme
MDILPFVPARHAREAVGIYVQALIQKLRPFFGTPEQATDFLAPHLRPDRAVVATDGGRLLGIAGFRMDGTGLFEPGWSDFRTSYGLLGGALRVAGLSLLEKPEDDSTLAMDGIAVADAARGRGAGTALLAEICKIARTSGRQAVRLDVIDTNPRARALYERNGFVAGKVTHLGPLSTLFGFSKATAMVKRLAPREPAPVPAHDNRLEAKNGAD